MPKLNHANLGEVQETAYLTGIVTVVNSELDTVDFTGVDNCPSGMNIPLFYHCTPESELRGNGALEGAAGAFTAGDEVIVQCEIVSQLEYKPLYVIGFTDKPKVCGFQFKLTRGDGTLITEASGLLGSFTAYTGGGPSKPITTPVYNEKSEYWSFKIRDKEDLSDEGYWIRYSCADGITTQYPYDYLPADKWFNPDTRIPYSIYEDTIPYYVVGSQAFVPIRDYSYNDNVIYHWSDDFPKGWGYLHIAGFIRTGHWCLIDPTVLSLSRNLTVKSSVPYKVNYAGYAKGGRELFYVHGAVPSYTFDNACSYLITSDGGNVTIGDGVQELDNTISYEPSISGRNHSLDVTFTARLDGYRVIAIDYPAGLGTGPIGIMTPTYVI